LEKSGSGWENITENKNTNSQHSVEKMNVYNTNTICFRRAKMVAESFLHRGSGNLSRLKQNDTFKVMFLITMKSHPFYQSDYFGLFEAHF